MQLLLESFDVGYAHKTLVIRICSSSSDTTQQVEAGIEGSFKQFSGDVQTQLTNVGKRKTHLTRTPGQFGNAGIRTPKMGCARLDPYLSFAFPFCSRQSMS